MKSIKEKAQEWANMYPSCGMADKSFQAGANYVLDAIEDFMNNIYLGSNAAERFYKSGLKANIHKFIEQLKNNQ